MHVRKGETLCKKQKRFGKNYFFLSRENFQKHFCWIWKLVNLFSKIEKVQQQQQQAKDYESIIYWIWLEWNFYLLRNYENLWILWMKCDHSGESYWAVLSDAVFGLIFMLQDCLLHNENKRRQFFSCSNPIFSVYPCRCPQRWEVRRGDGWDYRESSFSLKNITICWITSVCCNLLLLPLLMIFLIYSWIWEFKILFTRRLLCQLVLHWMKM